MPQPISDGTRPNILIFITDQFHPDCLGYAGHPMVRTPNLDRLAAGGMNFSRMYTSQPLCIPAHATMFTGLTPLRRIGRYEMNYVCACLIRLSKQTF